MDFEALKRVRVEMLQGAIFDQACARYVIESSTDRTHAAASQPEIDAVKQQVEAALT